MRVIATSNPMLVYLLPSGIHKVQSYKISPLAVIYLRDDYLGWFWIFDFLEG